MKHRTVGIAILTATFLFAGALPASAATQSWSTPVNLTPIGDDAYAPQITTAPDGAVTAIWNRLNGGNTVIQASTSTDHGTTWSAPTNVSAASPYAAGQQITAAPDGSLTATWYRLDGSNTIIQASTSTDHGITWSSPANLSASGQNGTSPQVTAAPDGTVTVIWSRSDGGNYVIQTSSSANRGATWTSPTNLSTAGQDALDPQITAAANGTLAAVWYRSDGSNYIIQTSTSVDHGATWTPASNLSAIGYSAINARIVVAPNDTFTAIWAGFDGTAYVIQTSSSSDHGASWTNPTSISAAGYTADAPQIAAATDSTLTAVWYRYDASGNAVIESSSSTDHGNTWTGAANLSTPGLDSFAPQITAAPDGTFTASWHRSDGSHTLIQASNSTNKGATWSIPVTLSAPGQDAFNPQVSAGPDGTLTAIWYRSDGSTFVIQSAVGKTAPVLTSITPPTPVVGTPYSFQITATGAPVPAFTVSSGTLPSGLTLSPEGLISGTPTTSANFTFVIMASNGAAPDATASYTLSLAPGATALATGSPTSTTTNSTPELANSGVNALPLGVAALALLLGLALVANPTPRRGARKRITAVPRR